MAKKWYEASYRRNLVDMHIADWDDSFLSKFSPEEYVENLKKAKIQTAMIYTQSHVGLTYYPTKVGPVHKAFQDNSGENKIYKTIRLCHESGISVVGYYSLIYNTWAEETHPEWRMQITPDGDSLHQRGEFRYGLCCPNNPEYREFVKTQVKELLEYFPLEGIFFDMTFWPYICNCPHCRERWEKESGIKDIPSATNWSDPIWQKFSRSRQNWMGEFAAWISDYSKSIAPDITTEHNYASGIAGSYIRGVNESVNDACDYCGGDLYGDLYSHSFAAKYYRGVSKNQPFEYMTSRCDVDLYQHTVTKSERHLTAEIMLTAAHHGASLIIDAIEPDGSMNEKVYEKVAKVFEKQMPYEKYFTGELVEDAAVLYSSSGRYDKDGIGLNHQNISVSAMKRLTESHIPCGIISNDHYERLKSHKLIIAPQIAGLPEANITMLTEYVKNGGSLYISGAYEPSLIRAFFGAEVKDYTESGRVYVSPTEGNENIFGEFSAKYPIQIDQRMPCLEGYTSDGVIAKINIPLTLPSKTPFVSIHSSPPGVLTDSPAVILKKFGEGKVMWSATPLEADERPSVRAVFLSLLGELMNMKNVTLKAKLPRTVETVLFKDSDRYLLSVNDHIAVDDERIVVDGAVSIKTGVKPSKITRISDGASLQFEYYETYGTASFELPPFSVFEMYEICL